MITTRTAGGTFKRGDRVSVCDDGRVRADPLGALEAFGDGSEGYLVTVGTPLAPSADAPSRVIRVGRDGAELGCAGGRSL